MIRLVYREQFVPGEPGRVWEFFATPRNLVALTPPQVRLRAVGGVAPRMLAAQRIDWRPDCRRALRVLQPYDFDFLFDGLELMVCGD